MSGRALFCVIPEKGHLNPYIGPAQHLQAMGWQVAFHAGRDIRAQLDRAGPFPFLGPDVPLDAGDIRRGAAFAEQVRDAPWLRGWIRRLLLEPVPQQVEVLRGLLRAWRPDVVVIDPMVYAAAIACTLEGLPWASISNSLNPVLPETGLDSELLATVRWLASDRERLFAGFGLTCAFRGCDVLSPHLTIAFTTREFVGGDVPGVHLVGPSIPPRGRGDEPAFDWSCIDGSRPLVYMSLGSQIYHQPSLFRAVIEASRRRDVELVLSVAELLDGDELPVPGPHEHAIRYVPQVDVLRRAAAFVTHGGANSVMEALACGVPLLVSPLCNDQFHQAHFVDAAGVGRSLDLRHASPDAVAEALDAVLDDPAIRARARRVSDSYRRDGAAGAARLVSALAAGNRRGPGS